MKDLKNLDAFVESVVSGNEEDSLANFSSYAKEKVSSIIQEFTEGNPIKLKGDDVFIKGKHVGTIDVDLEDFDAGISFTTDDKRFSKEFEDMEELYGFLADRYNVRESHVVETLSDSDFDERLSEAKKSARLSKRINERKKLKYKVSTGHDHKNDKPLYQVIGVNNEYNGEWHTDKGDAEKELDGLNGE